MSFLDIFRQVMSAGTPLPMRQAINFVQGALVADNQTLGSTDISFGIGPTQVFGSATASRVTSYVDYLQTANATPVAFSTAVFAMPDLTLADVVVTVCGKKVASADSFAQDYRARYTRNGTAPTIIGSVILGANPIGTGTLSTASATLLVSGNNVIVQVTGVAATSINWSAALQIQQVQ